MDLFHREPFAKMGTRKIEERRTGVTEQLSFLHPVDLKAVRKIVIKELKDYRALKVQLENKGIG